MRLPTAKTALDLTFQLVPFLSAALLIIAFYFARTEESPTFNFSKEDGLLEWGTVFFFTCCACLSLLALHSKRQELSKAERRFLVLFAVLLIIGIGEELSWGKRIVGWDVPAIVSETAGNPIQTDDTSLHNLRFTFSWGHVNPSDLIFSFFLPIGLFIQGILLPLGLRRNDPRAVRIVSRWGFFVPSLKTGALLFICAFLLHRLKGVEGVTDVREYEEFFIPFVFSFIIVDYYFRDSKVHAVLQGGLIVTVLLWLNVSLYLFS
jgi:hypothetical protein|tara:strand:+ start:21673 stop:22461 length:789 start_codon:yes stop_codon:yes gene_type:complete